MSVTKEISPTRQPVSKMSKKQRICIVGGGFGGLYTALRLHELPTEAEVKPEITLIDKGDRFLFSPLLYELITEEIQSWEIAPPFEEVLAHTGIIFRQGAVTNIDLDSKKVTVDNSLTVHYDKLVISTGGKTPLDKVPGALNNAIPFRSLKDAYRIIEKLRLLPLPSLNLTKFDVLPKLSVPFYD